METTEKIVEAYVRHLKGWFTLGWDDDVPSAAETAGVELWDFKAIIKEIAQQCRADRTYFTDDTMRTLQLMAMATK